MPLTPRIERGGKLTGVEKVSLESVALGVLDPRHAMDWAL